MPAPQQNPYDFIMNNGPQQTQGKFNLPSGKSTLQRVLIFGGGLFTLIIIGLIFISFIFGGGGSSEKLLSIAQEQTELIRVADLAKNERTVRLATTQNLASNVNIGVAASRAQLTPFIKQKGLEKKLLLKKNTQTDTKLTSAGENNQYDDVFVGIMKTQLATYQSDLQILYNETKDAKQKIVLKNAYDGATLLLKQANSK